MMVREGLYPDKTASRSLPHSALAAAIAELELVLAEPSHGWASRRLANILKQVVRDATADPWLTAVISLRDAGVLSADESLFLLGELWGALSRANAKTDPELRSLSTQMHTLIATVAGPLEPQHHAELDTLLERSEDRADELLGERLASLGETKFAELYTSPDDLWDARIDGQREFESRWPDPPSQTDEGRHQPADDTPPLSMPDTARRAYRQDIERGAGRFCADDEGIVAAAAMVEQALHFPHIDVDRLLARANRIAASILAQWAPEVAILEFQLGDVDASALHALPTVIERKLPALADLLGDSLNRLTIRALGEEYPQNAAEAAALTAKYAGMLARIETTEDAFLDVPLPDVGGLTLTQLSDFAHGDWVTTGLVRINGSLLLADLAQCDMVHDARTILAYIRDAGQVATVAPRTLSPAALAALIPQLRLQDEMLGQVHGFQAEAEDYWLAMTLTLLEVAGCTTAAAGNVSITKLGRSLLSDDRAGDLMATLFLTQFHTVSLRNFDRLEMVECALLDQFRAACFYLLGKHARQWTPAARLVNRVWPKPMRGNERFPLPELERDRGMVEFLIFSTRVLRPFVAFGLLDWCEGNSPGMLSLEYRLTPLFDWFLRFVPLGPRAD